MIVRDIVRVVGTSNGAALYSCGDLGTVTHVWDDRCLVFFGFTRGHAWVPTTNLEVVPCA